MADETTVTSNEQVNDALRGASSTVQADGKQQDEPLTFDKWYSSADDKVKAVIEDHTGGLKTALEGERKERKILADKIKALTKQAESGSDLQKQLEGVTAQMGEVDAKAKFYESAHTEGVKNLRLAWIAARDYELLGQGGEVDFAKLKTFAPELFALAAKTPPAKANGGEGAQQSGISKPSMNDFMRKAAGR